MTDHLPCSGACERNRDPILAVLHRHLTQPAEVLEIGSGTGQHAAYFAAALPHLIWQTSDLESNHAGIIAWIAQSGATNLRHPVPLDVRTGPWPDQRYDVVYSANTLHIMSWGSVEALFDALPSVLKEGGMLIVYGPFLYRARPTSESNLAFDQALRQADPDRGVRAFEAVDALARKAGLALVEDSDMPANNQCLVWRRDTAPAA